MDKLKGKTQATKDLLSAGWDIEDIIEVLDFSKAKWRTLPISPSPDLPSLTPTPIPYQAPYPSPYEVT